MPAEPMQGVGTCPKCGAPVSPIAQTCAKCGARLTPSTGIPDVPRDAPPSKPADADRVKDRVRHQDRDGNFRPPPTADPAPSEPAPASDGDDAPKPPAGPVIVKPDDTVPAPSEPRAPEPPPPPPPPAADTKPAPTPADTEWVPPAWPAPPAPEPAPEPPPLETIPVPQPAPTGPTAPTVPARTAPAPTGATLSRFGLHTERANLAAGVGVAGLVLGGLFAPHGQPVASAILLGVFAAAVVLWARTVTGWQSGLALVLAAALLLRLVPGLGIIAMPVALAFATSPDRVPERWFLHVVGVVIPSAAPLMVANIRGAALSGPALLASVLAVGAIAASHRIANIQPTPR